MERPLLRLTATVLSAPDAGELARFYQRLLGWELTTDEPGWAKLAPPGGGHGLSFHGDDGYRAPVWPGAAGDQRMMLHLDIRATDLEAAVAWAEQVGARRADFQPQDGVRVMLDPVGHPFCLYVH
jgi:catechol 2,3-dioxygenase-like lactoylglutathione lyase family enzyme